MMFLGYCQPPLEKHQVELYVTEKNYNLVSGHLPATEPTDHENLKRAWILCKINLKLQKNSMDQIFTGENKKNKKQKRKKQVEFLTFFEVYMFFQ